MKDIKSMDNSQGAISQAEITDISSTRNFNPESKSDFNPTSITEAEEVHAMARAESLESLRSRFMSYGCELTEEEIRQECEIVRQQLYDKYIAPTR